MTEKTIGGYEFNYEINNARNSTTIIRNALSKLIETSPGPQTTAMLIAQMAVELSKLNDTITNIEKIGANEKKKKTT